MKRATTVIILSALLIFADTLAAVETITRQAEFVMQTLAAEFAFGAAWFWIAFQLLRKKYRRQKRPATQWRFAIVQPLRRLFVSVWS